MHDLLYFSPKVLASQSKAEMQPALWHSSAGTRLRQLQVTTYIQLGYFQLAQFKKKDKNSKTNRKHELIIINENSKSTVKTVGLVTLEIALSIQPGTWQDIAPVASLPSFTCQVITVSCLYGLRYNPFCNRSKVRRVSNVKC